MDLDDIQLTPEAEHALLVELERLRQRAIANLRDLVNKVEPLHIRSPLMDDWLGADFEAHLPPANANSALPLYMLLMGGGKAKVHAELVSPPPQNSPEHDPPTTLVLFQPDPGEDEPVDISSEEDEDEDVGEQIIPVIVEYEGFQFHGIRFPHEFGAFTVFKPLTIRQYCCMIMNPALFDVEGHIAVLKAAFVCRNDVNPDEADPVIWGNPTSVRNRPLNGIVLREMRYEHGGWRKVTFQMVDFGRILVHYTVSPHWSIRNTSIGLCRMELDALRTKLVKLRADIDQLLQI